MKITKQDLIKYLKTSPAIVLTTVTLTNDLEVFRSNITSTSTLYSAISNPNIKIPQDMSFDIEYLHVDEKYAEEIEVVRFIHVCATETIHEGGLTTGNLSEVYNTICNHDYILVRNHSNSFQKSIGLSIKKPTDISELSNLIKSLKVNCNLVCVENESGKIDLASRYVGTPKQSETIST